MTISTHILRRGMEAAHGMMAASSEPDQPDNGEVQISPIAGLIFLASTMAMLFVLFSVSIQSMNVEADC